MALRLKFTLNPHTGREDLRFNGDRQGVWIEPRGTGYLVRLCEPADLYPYSWGGIPHTPPALVPRPP